MKSYIEVRRAMGGPFKGLYDLISEVAGDVGSASSIKTFKSDEQTGTGEAQTIPHGLGATPTVVWVEFTSIGTDGANFTEGTHGSVNCSVTVTSGAKYKVIALLIPTS